MRKVSRSEIRISDLKFIENSRLGVYDVSDLIESIKQYGLLSPIGIRKKDNAVIFGNRRIDAFKKLDYEEIECDIFEDVTDEDILILNLHENIARKSIGAIEIGRICSKLKEKGLSVLEISKKLGNEMTPSRISGSLAAYNLTVGTPYEKVVTYGRFGRQNQGNIPQDLIFKLQNSLSRARRLSEKDWKCLMDAIIAGRLRVAHVSKLRGILLANPKLDMNLALDLLQKGTLVRLTLFLNEKELEKLSKSHKIQNKIELVTDIIRKKHKELFF